MITKSPELERLIKLLKLTFIFGAMGGAMIITRDMGYNQVTVALMYLITALYVFLFFNEEKIIYKGFFLYFYTGFMILFILFYQDIYLKLGVVDTSTGEHIKVEKDALYFSIVTWTTLGYGDLRPSPNSRLYAASEAMLGYIYMSILVAKLFSWVNTIASAKNTKESSNN